MQYTDKLKTLFSDRTRPVAESYLSRLKNDSDRICYCHVFGDFLDVSGTEFLLADSLSVDAYMSWLRERCESGEMKYSTVLKYRKVLAAFSKYCIRLRNEGDTRVPESFEDSISRHPMANITENLSSANIPDFSDIDTIIGFLGEAPAEDSRLTAASRASTLTAVMMAFRMMLKTSEICSIRIEDMAYDAGDNLCIMIEKRDMVLLVPGDIRGQVEKQSENGTEWLFPSERGGHLDRKTLSMRLSAACREAGVEKVSFRTLRDATAAHAATNGAKGKEFAKAYGMKGQTHIRKLSTLNIVGSGVEKYINIRVGGGDD